MKGLTLFTTLLSSPRTKPLVKHRPHLQQQHQADISRAIDPITLKQAAIVTKTEGSKRAQVRRNECRQSVPAKATSHSDRSLRRIKKKRTTLNRSRTIKSSQTSDHDEKHGEQIPTTPPNSDRTLSVNRTQAKQKRDKPSRQRIADSPRYQRGKFRSRA